MSIFQIIIIIVFVYILIGIYKVIYDFGLGLGDQPLYVHNPKLIVILFVVITWFYYLVFELRLLGLKTILKRRKQIKIGRKIAKEEKAIRKKGLLFQDSKHSKALDKAMEEMKKEFRKQKEEDK